jgi:glycerol-3-phosphate cytidylyltransferase-like family protein
MGGIRRPVDTRSKILTADAARRISAPVTVVTGFFDVLRAEHARELRQAREKGCGHALLVVVLPLAGALLGQRARAEMAAGLRVVDYVVAADQADAAALIDSLKPAHLARLEEADARRARQLIEHVQHRQTAR